MTRILTVTYDTSNEDLPAMCVAESDLFFSIRVIKIFTGEKAEQLYKELTGQNVIVKVDDLEDSIKTVTNAEEAEKYKIRPKGE